MASESNYIIKAGIIEVEIGTTENNGVERILFTNQSNQISSALRVLIFEYYTKLNDYFPTLDPRKNDTFSIDVILNKSIPIEDNIFLSNRTYKLILTQTLTEDLRVNIVYS